MKYLFLFMIIGAVAYEKKTQTVNVTGTLTCNGTRFAGALIEILEEDLFDPNDVLASGYSNLTGEFMLEGSEDEILDLDPIVRITHGCKASQGCRRVVEYRVPERKGSKYTFNYHMSFVALDVPFSDETTICCTNASKRVGLCKW